MYKLLQTIYLDDPETLMHKVLKDIVFYTGRRGREGLRKLTVNSFREKTNEQGHKYMVLTHNETKQKKQGDESGSRLHNSEHRPVIMQQSHLPRCPVLSYEKHLSHLKPSVKHLFQQPKRRVNPNFDQVWYEKTLVGQRTIGDFLKMISTRFKCSKIYTNHCLRHTMASTMKKAGFNIHQFVYVTDHSNYQSLGTTR